MKNMNVQELIKKYDIHPITDGANAGKIRIMRMPSDKGEQDALLARAQEIKDIFAAQAAKEAAETARIQANIAAIPGLVDIQAFRLQYSQWKWEYEESFESENRVAGITKTKKPEGDIEKLLEAFPQAAAYLRAEKQSQKNNYELSEIGKKTLNAFQDNPENWETIMKKMDEELELYTKKHMWD